MANGSPNGRSRIGGRAVDLSARKARASMTDEEARRAQEALEHQQLRRCNGCGRRLGLGMVFTSIDPRAERPVIVMAACAGEDCDFADRCRDGATFMEMVEVVWMDQMGVGAPASLAVQERNAELARREQSSGCE